MDICVIAYTCILLQSADTEEYHKRWKAGGEEVAAGWKSFICYNENRRSFVPTLLNPKKWKIVVNIFLSMVHLT